ncbi:MAG: transcriptional regulator, partial [Spirochaetia bacterium]|nr:transcriptional regulator [Spirochaetia bacterium]
IVDAEDRELLEEVIQILEPLIPVPVKRPRKKKQG